MNPLLNPESTSAASAADPKPAGLSRMAAEDARVQTWLNQLGRPWKGQPLDESQHEQAWLWCDAAGRALAALRWCLAPAAQAPSYSFHQGCMVHGSREIKLFQTHHTLQLGNDHTGQAELLELAHAPELGRAQAVAAMSQLLQAAARQELARRSDLSAWMTVELPGWRDAGGQSPFWRGLGALLCQADPALAEQQWGERWQAELAALMPKTTVYLSLMGAGVRAASGRAADFAQAHIEALRAAGFVSSQHVRIDDGGPILMRALQ
jgi:arginine/ornithine N-succinyltransferase beta subunit